MCVHKYAHPQLAFPSTATLPSTAAAALTDLRLLLSGVLPVIRQASLPQSNYTSSTSAWIAPVLSSPLEGMW